MSETSPVHASAAVLRHGAEQLFSNAPVRELAPLRVLVVLQRCADNVSTARHLSRQLAGRLARGLGAPLRMSRSATPGLAAVACARNAVLGVDVERIRPELLDSALLHAALTPAEVALAGASADFFHTWARKEAVLKAMETGLAVAPASFTAFDGGLHWSLVGGSTDRVVWMLNLPVPPEYAGAIAVSMKADGPPAVPATQPAIACRVVLLQRHIDASRHRSTGTRVQSEASLGLPRCVATPER